MKLNIKKHHLASLAQKYNDRKISRRDFLSNSVKLGLGIGALSAIGARPFSLNAAGLNKKPDKEVLKWLKDVSKPFKGTTIRLATEATPPSVVLNKHLKRYFEKETGIKVVIDILPLEQVLQKMTLDVASQLNSYDIYYIDQSWAASFSQDVVDPREKLEKSKNLAMPNYDIDDFLKPLVDGICMYNGTMVGVPYDIPIFIQMYNGDIFKKLGLKPATTMNEYLSNAQAIQKAYKGKIYGTTGQMKSGHYSLECDWTTWLWGHGGSIFGDDKKFSGNDDKGIEAMEYWVKLKENMPKGVTSWTWDGQGNSLTQGIAGQVITWGEVFPAMDNPKDSKVAGKMEAALVPNANSLRTIKQTGFGEIPGVGHQGGSSLGVSKYSKNLDAAWLFTQWATSYDTQALITVLGGGTGPTRKKVYDDKRLKENAKRGIAGTTRHLDIVRDTISDAMGSEPDLPEWAEISNDTIPVELGRFFAGEYKTPKACLDVIAKKVNKIVKS